MSEDERKSILNMIDALSKYDLDRRDKSRLITYKQKLAQIETKQIQSTRF